MLGSLEARELGGRRSPRKFQEVLGRPPGDHQEDLGGVPEAPGLGGPWEAFRTQDSAKKPQETARKPPGRRQEVPKVPRRPQERRKKCPRGPQESEEPLQESPNAAPDANTTKSVILTTLSRKFVLFRWSGPSKMAENWPQNGPRRKTIAQETPRESR